MDVILGSLEDSVCLQEATVSLSQGALARARCYSSSQAQLHLLSVCRSCNESKAKRIEVIVANAGKV